MSSRSTVSASRALAILLVAGATLLAMPRASHAKKRIVLLDFIGDRARPFEEKVRAIVKQRAAVISHRQYVDTADELGASKPTNENVSLVARELGADGVIIGIVDRKGPRYELTLKLRAGADGEFFDTITVRTRRPRLRGAALRKVRRQLQASIRRLPPLQEVIEEEPFEAEEDVIAEADVEDDRRDVRRERDDDEDDEPGVTDERKADLLARGRGLEIMGGISVMNRNLSFTVSADLGEEAPRGYSGTPVASAYILGELYPLAFDLENEGITRNLGVSFVFDRVLKIESRLRYEDADMMQQEAVLPTEQQRYGVGAVYRHNFGSKPTSPTIKIALRYNRAKFIIDKTAAPMGVDVDIPNMDYVYYDPGLALRYPLSETLALQADGRFLLVTDTGEMQQTDQYGGATVTGYDIDAGGEYKVNPRLFVRVGARIIGVAYDFKGTGAETTDRDGDPNDQDVFGAIDRYLGGYGVLGYLF